MTTHSPHVLSTVDYESIRIIRLDHGQGVLTIPPFQTQGVQSADVLAKVMDVNPVPQMIESARWLSEYRVLIQTGEYDSPAGQNLFEKLVTHFGEEHPVLVEVETLRRLQEFRRASKIPPQQSN
jgi:predicted ATP-binding protein involved in virulence